MPPSYSMMLPGRMSTPLIFMIAYLPRLGKEPPRQPRFGGSLAAALFPGKQRVRIDGRSVPPALARRHRIDREMEVRAGGAGIAGMADAGDHLATLDLLTLGEPRRVGRQVGVIINPFLVRRPLVDGDPAAHAVEQFFDGPVGRRDDRRSFIGHDVDGVMTSTG